MSRRRNSPPLAPFAFALLGPALLAGSAAVPVCNVDPPSQCAWFNPRLSDNVRVSALVSALSLPEKISLLGSESPGVARLRVPAYGWSSEASHGVAYSGVATVFPSAIAVGATFDVEKAEAAGKVVALEARAHFNAHRNSTTGASASIFGLDFFAPVINIVKDIRWGRTQETYGEDPHLNGELGAAYARGIQQHKL